MLNYSSCFTESQLWFDLDIYLFIYLLIDLVILHYLFISAEAESGVLEKTLRYATGLRELPPLGINPRPSLAFRHRDYLDPEDASKEYPIANTCANVLHLPIISRYDTFKERVLAALTVVVFTNEWLSLHCHSYCCLYVLPNWTVLIQAWSCLKKKCVIYFLRSIMYAQLGVFSTVPNLAYHTYINRLNNFFKTETTTVYVFGAHLYITNGQIDSWL